MPREVEQAKERHILIVRTDRIGDVVLSLPMVEALHAWDGAVSVSFLVRTYTRELVEGAPGVAGVLNSDTGDTAKPFWTLVRELRLARFDVAVIASPTLRTALAVRFAGIRVRVGTGYRWYSSLFNRRVYEHRKTALKHEAQFNVSLLGALGVPVPPSPKPVLTIPGSAREAALALRRAKGFAPSDRLVVLHPGSGGSARDWKAENFGRLARHLAAAGAAVLVTGGRGEEPLVERVCAAAQMPLETSVGKLGLMTLAALLESASLFVSNSTGPLHIASAVGTPVIAFYPPIIQCSPRRWGPLAERKVVFEADAGRCPRCQGGPCQGDDCMEQITVEEVTEAARSLLGTDLQRRPEVLAQ